MIDENHLVWIDMEMSGLSPENDVILEIATIITNKNLDIIAEGPSIVIHHKEDLFDKMDEWNQTHHTKSGLWQKVTESKNTLKDAEKETLEFISKYLPPQTSPLCGNTISQDRAFLRHHMPTIDAYLHYRLIDVSTIKELAKRWYQDSIKPPIKKNCHRALDDIKESIEELKFYRSSLFINR